MLADEDPMPSNGPLFPLPMQAPRWRGLNGNAPAYGGQAYGEQSYVGQETPCDGTASEAMNVDPQVAAASQEKSKGSPFSGAVADFDASNHNPSALEVMPLQMVAPIVSQVRLSLSEVINALNI